MLKKILFLYFILCFNAFSFGQKGESVPGILTKVEKYYKTQNEYNYQSVYTIYKNPGSDQTAEVKQGIMLKLNGVSYQQMEGIESFNFGKSALVIDNAEKAIYVSKSIPEQSPLSLKSYLKAFPNNKIISDPNYWICEMSASGEVPTQYHKIRFYINKGDFSIWKEVFYVKGNQSILKKGKKITLKDPRLEIVFQKRNSSRQADKQLIKRDNYYVLRNGKAVLSNKYKKYRLVSN